MDTDKKLLFEASVYDWNSSSLCNYIANIAMAATIYPIRIYKNNMVHSVSMIYVRMMHKMYTHDCTVMNIEHYYLPSLPVNVVTVIIDDGPVHTLLTATTLML